MGSILISELNKFKMIEREVVEKMDGRDEYNEFEVSYLNNEIEKLANRIVNMLGKGELYDVMLDNSVLNDIEIKF